MGKKHVISTTAALEGGVLGEKVGLPEMA